MSDKLLPVVVVHGVGSGSNRDRAGFSRPLSNQVHEPHSRPVVRVGPHEQPLPTSLPANCIHWAEALWESVNDAPDALTEVILKAAVPNPPTAWLTRQMLDILGDVPLYLGPQGDRIREVVRGIISAHPHCVVVAHSLGSVIAADVLREVQLEDNFATLPVSALITLGSPLQILKMRSPMTDPFPFPWRNFFYPTDLINLRKGLKADTFPGVTNSPLNAGEGFAVSHTSYWYSTVLAGTVYRFSVKGR